jgi:6-pyruvoyltetrahydropterin/6-carboxytetrahydropterin synthase
MFRLTREVRFALNPAPNAQLRSKPTNSFGGFPTITGLSRYYAIRVTLAGELNPKTSYLRNIKEIDEVVRGTIIPLMSDFSGSAERLLCDHVFPALKSAWAGALVERIELVLTPYCSLAISASEFPMVHLSQKFEFSASHRLHSSALSDEENRKCFGKCNNPQGHGHNYEVEVTLKGDGRARSLLECLPDFERIVAETAIEPLDHKNLNAEVAEFRDVIPTVENIAKVIYRLLKPKFEDVSAQLSSVTVWETQKTWCEYSE